MSSVHRAATLSGLTVISASAALLTRYVIVNRESVARSLSPTTRAGLLRLILLLFSLLNIKNLPFVWHIRFLVRALFYHFRIEPKSVPPASLFEPLVTSTRAPLLECDTNLHKSNSTYFSDLDQSRAHLYACLMQKAFMREWKDDFLKPQSRPSVNGIGDGGDAKEKKKEEEGKAYSDVVKEEAAAGEAVSTSSTVFIDSSTTNGALTAVPSTNPAPSSNSNNNRTTTNKPFPEPKGPYNMLLGSVSCHYHREIPPYTRYELWSRVLTWDNKWFYSVTHIVKPGVAVPKRWTLQPWRRMRERRSSRSTNQEGNADADAEVEEARRIKKLKDSIYATSIAKVVMKRGRLTIPPEIVLQRSGLLPERPSVESEAKPETQPETKPNENENEDEGTRTMGTANGTVDVSSSSSSSPPQWTWHTMEQRRQEGLELANKFAELDAAQALFDGGSRDGALGEYADLFWA